MLKEVNREHLYAGYSNIDLDERVLPRVLRKNKHRQRFLDRALDLDGACWHSPSLIVPDQRGREMNH